jgi:hypothetical protein
MPPRITKPAMLPRDSTGIALRTAFQVALLVDARSKPSERTSCESIAVPRLTPDEASERMSEIFPVRLLDTLDGNGPHVRSHDGKRLIPAG